MVTIVFQRWDLSIALRHDFASHPRREIATMVATVPRGAMRMSPSHLRQDQNLHPQIHLNLSHQHQIHNLIELQAIVAYG